MYKTQIEEEIAKLPKERINGRDYVATDATTALIWKIWRSAKNERNIR